MASRGSSGVLGTISSDALNKLHNSSHPGSKRRKINHDDTAGGLTIKSFRIRPNAAAPSDKPVILDPITLFPRSRLPLSWLDISSAPFSSVPQIQHGSALFVSDIPALEECMQGHTLEPVVLITRAVSDGGGLCAVERVKRGLYALTILGRGIDEGDIFVAMKGWRAPSVAEPAIECESLSCASEGTSWWETARIAGPVADSKLSLKRSAFDDVSIVFSGGPNDERVNVTGCHPSPPDSTSFSATGVVAPIMERSSSADLGAPVASREQSDPLVPSADAGNENVDTPQSAQELLDSLREQYLQALYISKTSVAYFAKGPLARCRAAFQPSEPEDSKKPSDLVAFYREAILTTKRMDLKYRETLPSTISNVVLSISGDEANSHQKRHKNRKKRLGKNGLYPEEGEFIQKWWKDRNLTEQATVQTNREAETKKHVADLRLRETQLQILLILEAMALESNSSDESKEETGDKTVKASKPKKMHDLNVLLELHLDRMCIWHAVSFEETVVTDSFKLHDNNHLAGKKVESDAVRDFCTEVIIPFYGPRLPEKCKLITRKFGVSSSSQSSKSSNSKNASRPEPGSVVKRQAPSQQQQQQQQQQQHPEPQKSRRALQRVLTDEKVASRKRRHPSLTRSSTEPTQWDAKRESMEPLLPVLGTSVRGGIQKPKRVDNREVDLNAAAKQHEAKLKKMQILVDQKKELDAAINALRRPNRELVARDIADAADKRLSSGGGSSRKPKNPVRNPLGHGVQVMATPKGSRKKNVSIAVGVPFLPSLARKSSSSLPSARVYEPSSPFGSEVQVVPGSTVRPGASSSGLASGPILGSDMNQGDNAGVGAIQETPCRRPPPRPVGRNRVPLKEEGLNTHYFSGYGQSGNNPFRVPNLPAPHRSNPETETENDNEMAPSTPIPARRVGTRKPSFQHGLSGLLRTESHADRWSTLKIQETPPSKQSGNGIAGTITAAKHGDDVASPCLYHSPPAIFCTPVKHTAKPAISPAVAKPETPEKSIYEQLGWDAEDDL